MARYLIPSLLFLLLSGWQAPAGGATLYFFYAENCPHCAEEEPFLASLAEGHPGLEIRRYQVWNNRENFDLLLRLSNSFGFEAVSTPATAVGDRLWFGFSAAVAAEIETTVEVCLAAACPDPLARLNAPQPPPAAAPEGVETPLGRIEVEQTSLPVLTVLLGLLDSVNPCAFFVLLFLLSLLVHARSRATMLLVGGTFVLCSGMVYFLFMAAWLNLFLLAGRMRLLTAAAGLTALLVAALNIKDYFLFRRGPTLSLSEEAKPKLFARMRGLLQASRISSVLFGAAVLALAANSYELLCTAGLPMVYTRILTLKALPSWQYYGYLALYNLVYVTPLAVIVVAFTVTLGSRKLTEAEGRVLKLVSGLMMLCLGLTLLWQPALLHRLSSTLLLLALPLAAAVVIIRLYPPGGGRGRIP